LLGVNKWVAFGNRKNDFISYKPKSNQYLINDKIIDISCGFGHTLSMTNSGEVYAWGSSKFGQIGDGSYGFFKNQSITKKVNGFNG
jgi:alpha-tubulin suppressor-like RCC1 family protein